MKITIKETDNEYKIIKEKPYKDLISTDTLVSIGVFFLVLILINLYILIPILVFFALLGSLQTIEENFIVTIYKKKGEFTIARYYMGIWKYKIFNYKAIDYNTVQVEKQVTSIKEDGRFSIQLSTELPDSEKKGKVLVLVRNIDLEDIEQAKIISFFLDLLYDSRIKYKTEISLLK